MVDQTVFEILHNMDLFTNRLIIKWNKKFKEELGVSHILTLGYLNRRDKARPSDIAKALGLTPPTVTHLTEKLVKRGYVVRLLDDTDRRIVQLAITDEGKAILKRADESGQILRQEMFLKLTEPEREELLRLYQKLNAPAE